VRVARTHISLGLDVSFRQDLSPLSNNGKICALRKRALRRPVMVSYAFIDKYRNEREEFGPVRPGGPGENSS